MNFYTITGDMVQPREIYYTRSDIFFIYILAN